MAAKLPTFIDLETKKQNPGPGSYSNRITDLRNSGSYILSNFKYTLAYEEIKKVFDIIVLLSIIFPKQLKYQEEFKCRENTN